MTAPFFEYGAFGHGTSLAIAAVIGLAFGWALERAGLGSARKLAGQFYLTDLTVLKVMFSAVLTAMLGVFWLAGAGVLDLRRVYVPETYLAPQLVGGLVFGAGFALASLCPGTACVSAATGRQDGLSAVAGMFTGMLLTGVMFAPLARFYESGARGAFTLPTLTGAPYGVVVFGIVLVSIAAFHAAGRIERRVRP